MAALELLQQGWFSPRYSLLREGIEIAVIDTSSHRERAVFRFENREYQMSCHGFLRNQFVLVEGGTPVAQATKRFWRANFLIEYEGRSCRLESRAFWKRSFSFLKNEQTAGTIVPGWFLPRKAEISLPDHLAVPIQVFLVWLAIVQWGRDSASAGA